jgi:hypothetical protein
MATEEAKDQQAMMIYGSFPPEQWPQIYAQQQLIDQANHEAMSAAAEAAGQPAPMQQPTQPPPVDGFLPKNTARRIYTVWKRMLPVLKNADAAAATAEDLGIETDAVEAVRQIDRFLQMRAVIEAAKRLAEQRMMEGAQPGMAPQGEEGQ